MAIENSDNDVIDISDQVAATAFRRLVAHLRQRHDAQNIDLMGLSGFCRNCLADWIADASNASDREPDLDKEAARELIYGMPFETWKKRYQEPASEEQLLAMKRSVAKNAKGH